MIGLLAGTWRRRWPAATAVIRALSADERAGTVVLWHPDSPDVRIRVRPSLLRRLGWYRLLDGDDDGFATLGETRRMVSYVSGLAWIAASEMEHVVDARLVVDGPAPEPPPARGDAGAFS